MSVTTAIVMDLLTREVVQLAEHTPKHKYGHEISERLGGARFESLTLVL